MLVACVIRSVLRNLLYKIDVSCTFSERLVLAVCAIRNVFCRIVSNVSYYCLEILVIMLC